MNNKVHLLHEVTPLRLGEVAGLRIEINTESQGKKSRNTFQTKEQEQMSEGAFSESDISDLPNKEFKITVMKLVTELRRRKDKQGELSRKRQKIRKYQVEVTGMKNTINEKYSRGVPQQTKTKKISELKDRK